jgi:acetyl-CoA carboxylase beta subunit
VDRTVNIFYIYRITSNIRRSQTYDASQFLNWTKCVKCESHIRSNTVQNCTWLALRRHTRITQSGRTVSGEDEKIWKEAAVA